MTRTSVILLLAVLTAMGLSAIAGAQEADDCYPVPIDGCPTEEPTLQPATEPEPATESESEEAVAGDKPGGTVQLAQQAAPSGLAQTGVPAVALGLVTIMALVSGAVLLRTGRRPV